MANRHCGGEVCAAQGGHMHQSGTVNDWGGHVYRARATVHHVGETPAVATTTPCWRASKAGLCACSMMTVSAQEPVWRRHSPKRCCTPSCWKRVQKTQWLASMESTQIRRKQQGQPPASPSPSQMEDAPLDGAEVRELACTATALEETLVLSASATGEGKPPQE